MRSNVVVTCGSFSTLKIMLCCPHQVGFLSISPKYTNHFVMQVSSRKRKELISNHPETGKLQYVEKRFVLSGASSVHATDGAFSYDL